MHAGSELQTMHLVHLIFKTLSIYENRKNLFKEVYFWNKIKNRIKNHGFVFEMGLVFFLCIMWMDQAMKVTKYFLIT
jgi:hypothetical protein